MSYNCSCSACGMKMIGAYHDIYHREHLRDSEVCLKEQKRKCQEKEIKLKAAIAKLRKQLKKVNPRPKAKKRVIRKSTRQVIFPVKGSTWHYAD